MRFANSQFYWRSHISFRLNLHFKFGFILITPECKQFFFRCMHFIMLSNPMIYAVHMYFWFICFISLVLLKVFLFKFSRKIHICRKSSIKSWLCLFADFNKKYRYIWVKFSLMLFACTMQSGYTSVVSKVNLRTLFMPKKVLVLNE